GGEELNNLGDVITLRVYFSNRESALLAKDKFKENFDGNITILNTDYKEWIKKWRNSIKPVELKKGWWVSPLWRPPVSNVNKEDIHWIKIEPKMAFGTGHHESTRLAAKVIIEGDNLVRGKKILDIGTGSGILSFIAAEIGAKWCLGIEIDRECLENLSENRELNLCRETCSFVIGSVVALKENIKFDVIVMNMLHIEAAPLLSYCKKLVSKDGCLVWSGILKEEKDTSIAVAQQNGFILKEEFTENEWWCGSFYSSNIDE
ncbi:MAG: 50S ribosomal protein L11 methyltransferase, partial [Chitinispirillaceae bacterium]|nr:50S ribosomal protein L11 methyltransferase [Chitinispirillaceae bacterium]